MKDMKYALAFCALFTTTTAGAQQAKTFEKFFSETLKGEQIAFDEGKKVKVKNIADCRAKVWQAWVDANRRYEEDKLIDITPLEKANSGKWTLPEALEPHAVMPYYFGSKGECPEKGYPLFLHLHGSGPKEGEWAASIAWAKRFDDAPSVFFIPQIPNEGQYYRWQIQSKQYAYEKLFRQAFLNPSINPDRLYVMGISEGGYGSQRFASFYADYIAAAGPMAGGEPLKNAPVENCRNIGFSLLTGDLDNGFYRRILTTYTKEAFDSIQTIHPDGYRHRIELIPGKGHGFDYSPTTPWLKQFVRNPWPKAFTWEDMEMSDRHRPGFYNIIVNKRPDEKLRTRYDVEIKENVVNVKVQNVHYTTIQKDPHWGIEMKFAKSYSPVEGGKFTLYFDEHLVDLTKKVVVNVNGKEVFNGKLKCNSANMATTLATFYDPQRIYPAAVEVDL